MCDNNKLLRLLSHKGVEIDKLSSHEEEAYVHEWFNRVVPEDKQQAAMELNCFGENKPFGDSTIFMWGYLWHVFSFGLLDSVKEEDAKRELNSILKEEAIMLDYLNRDAYRLKGISIVSADVFDSGEDILLTCNNYKWTYAKTHEPDLGPYFHYIRLL